MVLLDTSVCVHALRGHEPTVRRLAEMGAGLTILSAMTVAELRYGLLRGRPTKRARARAEQFLAAHDALPFDAKAAEHHAIVRHTLAVAGTPISERDLVIASTALAHGLVVATGNVREFRRVPGLEVEEWA